MHFSKLFLLLTCFLISQSFAGHQKKTSKSIEYFDKELNPKFYASMITKLLCELKRTTPAGHKFSSEIAVNHLLNNIDDALENSKKPYYIKITKHNESK